MVAHPIVVRRIHRSARVTPGLPPARTHQQASVGLLVGSPLPTRPPYSGRKGRLTSRSAHRDGLAKRTAMAASTWLGPALPTDQTDRGGANGASARHTLHRRPVPATRRSWDSS